MKSPVKIIFANRKELHLAPSDILLFLDQNEAPPEMINEFTNLLDKTKHQRLELNKLSKQKNAPQKASQSFYEKEATRLSIDVKNKEDQIKKLNKKVKNQKEEIKNLSKAIKS